MESSTSATSIMRLRWILHYQRTVENHQARSNRKSARTSPRIWSKTVLLFKWVRIISIMTKCWIVWVFFFLLGIGSIPDAVLAALTNHKDLGIHSEMFAGGVIDLVNRGCVTNNKKTMHKGRIVGSFLIGTKDLYDFVDNNPFIEMLAVDYVNNTGKLEFCYILSSSYTVLRQLRSW